MERLQKALELARAERARKVLAAVVKAAAGLGAGSVPAGIAALAQGGLKTMSLRKSLVIAVALLLGLGALGGGTAMLAQAPAREQAGAREAAAPTTEETDLALFARLFAAPR